MISWWGAGSFPWGQLFEQQLYSRQIIRNGIFFWSNCPVRNCPGSIFFRTIVRGPIIRWGAITRGDNPWAIIWAAIIQGTIVRWVIIRGQCFSGTMVGNGWDTILKYADITPFFKKGDTTDNGNYRPISTLSNFSKIFERLIYTQINLFIENKLLIYLAGFRKNHNIQHNLPESVLQSCS